MGEIAEDGRMCLSATILSAIFPGLGSMVYGRTLKGFLIFVSCWLFIPYIYGIWAAYKDIPRKQPPRLVVLKIVAGFGIILFSILAFGAVEGIQKTHAIIDPSPENLIVIEGEVHRDSHYPGGSGNWMEIYSSGEKYRVEYESGKYYMEDDVRVKGELQGDSLIRAVEVEVTRPAADKSGTIESMTRAYEKSFA